SFVGSSLLGILIADRVYQQGGYTGRESAMIATGFSTVSSAFMVIVAKSLDLMHMWTTFFFTTLVITFAVTAITVHIPPLRTIPDEYFEGSTPSPEHMVTSNRLKAAAREGLLTLAAAPSLAQSIWVNFRGDLCLSVAIVPSIISV